MLTHDWLMPRADAPGPGQALLDELSGLLADDSVRAHALLVLELWAEPLLDTLLRRMPAVSWRRQW